MVYWVTFSVFLAGRDGIPSLMIFPMLELDRLRQRRSEIAEQLKILRGPGDQFRLRSEMKAVESDIERLGGSVTGGLHGSVREYLTNQRRRHEKE